jgi:integrase
VVSTSRPLERTSTPGIFKRDGRYVVVFRDPQGRQRKRYAKTLAEAKDLKAVLRADVSRGEYRSVSKVVFADHALRWIETYPGRTSKGIDESTRDDYRKRLVSDAIPFFGRMQLAAIEPQHIRDFAATVAAQGVKPNTVRLSLAPVKALLACAFEDGLIRTNPAAGVRIVAPRETSPRPLSKNHNPRVAGSSPAAAT